MGTYKFSIILLILLSPGTNAVDNSFEITKVESKVLDELNKTGEVEVIVVLNDAAVNNTKNGAELSKKQILEQKKSMIFSQQEKVLSTLELSYQNGSIDFKLFHRYLTVNAFSGKLTKQGLEKLKNNSNVKNIIFDERIYASLDRSIPLINADDVWAKPVNGLNVTGLGETVCIIDTGVNYTHTDLGGGWGNKVIGGYDFVNNDTDPMDDWGHGTYVAGVVASTNEIYKGVAPGAKIVAIKSLDSSGLGLESDGIAGIDWCVNNASFFNISVITMSLGDNKAINTYCDNKGSASGYLKAINAAVGQGILVAVASGNNEHTTGISAPACIKNATSVGASDGTLYDSELFVTSENKELDSNPLEYSALSSGLTAELLYAGMGYPSNFTGQDFTGKTALVKRGGPYLYEKVQNAYDAGASGVIIYNNETGNFNDTLMNTSKIPAVSISLENGAYLVDLLENETVEINMSITVNESIWSGTNRGIILDLLAPGAGITSTSLKASETSCLEGCTCFGNYMNCDGGTSIATPHVAGAALLLMQYQKERNESLTPLQIENTLKETGISIYDPLTNLTFPRINILGAFNRYYVAPDGFCDSDDNCSENQFCNSTNSCQDLTCSSDNEPFNHQCYHVCDLDHDGIYINDWDDLMTAYRCFLGIENCDNYYQNWNLIKQEYECFVRN